ncbi:unnamed protein product [Caenorhabditis angaria]|uniref:NADAR domain-containing protein n=1 Tax=Caenorhabditis angaria TaxID=860376 RepID=A0A9P1MZW4_9PELO|nr:unnamed protein product [Caenorhabditis angaria]
MGGGKGKKQQKTVSGELSAPNNLAPLQPLTSAEAQIQVQKPAVQRPKYAQNISAEVEKKTEDFSNDSFSGEQFTSFGERKTEKAKSDSKEKRNNNNGYKKKKSYRKFALRPLEAQPTKQLTEDIEIIEYHIEANNFLPFFGPNHFLSALYPVEINVDGHSYNSVEHYYQACKVFTLAGKDTAQLLRTATTPIEVKQEVKKILKDRNIEKANIEKWKRLDSFTVLEHAIYQKFKQNEELRKKLLDSQDKILVQTYMGDNFFAANATVKTTTEWMSKNAGQTLNVPKKIDNSTFEYFPIVVNGKNMLGMITMKVREQIRSEL